MSFQIQISHRSCHQSYKIHMNFSRQEVDEYQTSISNDDIYFVITACLRVCIFVGRRCILRMKSSNSRVEVNRPSPELNSLAQNKCENFAHCIQLILGRWNLKLLPNHEIPTQANLFQKKVAAHRHANYLKQSCGDLKVRPKPQMNSQSLVVQIFKFSSEYTYYALNISKLIKCYGRPDLRPCRHSYTATQLKTIESSGS